MSLIILIRPCSLKVRCICLILAGHSGCSVEDVCSSICVSYAYPTEVFALGNSKGTEAALGLSGFGGGTLAVRVET